MLKNPGFESRKHVGPKRFLEDDILGRQVTSLNLESHQTIQEVNQLRLRLKKIHNIVEPPHVLTQLSNIINKTHHWSTMDQFPYSTNVMVRLKECKREILNNLRRFDQSKESNISKTEPFHVPKNNTKIPPFELKDFGSESDRLGSSTIGTSDEGCSNSCGGDCFHCYHCLQRCKIYGCSCTAPESTDLSVSESELEVKPLPCQEDNPDFPPISDNPEQTSASSEEVEEVMRDLTVRLENVGFQPRNCLSESAENVLFNLMPERSEMKKASLSECIPIIVTAQLMLKDSGHISALEDFGGVSSNMLKNTLKWVLKRGGGHSQTVSLRKAVQLLLHLEPSLETQVGCF